MNRTDIEWTNYSVNPFKMRMPDGTLINVCIHKSEGCRNCYAEMIVRRWWKQDWGEFPGYTAALLRLGTPVLVVTELEAVLRLSKRIAQEKADPKENQVFWNDMTDEFLDFWPDEFIDKCWAVRALTPNLIHQVLTKRIDRACEYLGVLTNGDMPDKDRIDDLLNMPQWINLPPYQSWPRWCYDRWPLPNVHLACSVENQREADERRNFLRDSPAAVKFVSYEPALEEIDWAGWDFVNQIIVGGESGTCARPFDLAWARNTIAWCRVVGVAPFVKQLGSKPESIPDLISYRGSKTKKPAGFYRHLDSSKGGDMAEWPEDLRVREFPSQAIVSRV